MTTRLLCCALVLATGCTFLVDDEIGGLGVNQNAKRDVSVVLIDFHPHLGQYVDIQIVRPPDPDDPASTAVVQARGIFDGLASPCVELSWPLGAPFDATRIDFYADLDGNGEVSAPGDDHLWRRDLPEDGAFTFFHDILFDDIGADLASETGNDLIMDLTGVGAHDGQTVTVAVVRRFREAAGSQQITVPGILVVGNIEGGVLSSVLPGVLDDSEEYVIELNFGEGANICRIDVRAPDAAALTITSDLADLSCGLDSPQQVYLDVLDRERCEP